MASLVKLETYRGDADDLLCEIGNEDITGWEIRCEVWDNNQSGVLNTNFFRKATDNVTGGDDTQILITDGPNGKFTIFISSGNTTNLGKDVQIEIQTTDTLGNNSTVLKSSITLFDQRIEWATTTS